MNYLIMLVLVQAGPSCVGEACQQAHIERGRAVSAMVEFAPVRNTVGFFRDYKPVRRVVFRVAIRAADVVRARPVRRALGAVFGRRGRCR